MTGLIGALTFTSPWLLMGLAVLPIIWWLLRLTPPRPETVPFPPAALLLGLRAREKTPVRSPWWLTLLRLVILAALIAALAGPVLRPTGDATTGLSRPLAVVVDNGWTAASRWARRKSIAEQLAAVAEENTQTLYLIPTAGPTLPLRPLTPPEFRQRFASLLPQPYAGDRTAAAQQMQKELGSQRGKLRIAWLSDSVEDKGAEQLREKLTDLADGSAIDVYSDVVGTGPLAIARTSVAGAGVLRARISKSEAAPRNGDVAAVTAKGERLAVVPFAIPSGKGSAEVALELPLELRNQIAELAVSGEASAGGVFLLDARSQRRKVGLIASEDAENSQPLLSPTYYLERALSPFADISRPRTANLDIASSELIAAAPSVIVLSDVGKLTGAARERLREYVEKGGMLIRFAGPRLEQGGDNLLPARLREGGRTLGGAMTWTSPQIPAPFEQGSPFEGLAIPKDVVIAQQVLTDPASMPRETQVWARLADGTPLVTAVKRGAGQLVFFHITANPDWSNLPISGLFVEMMRKVVELSPLQLARTSETAAPASDAAASHAGPEAFLKPWRVLDGFGKLIQPGEHAQAVAAAKIDAIKASPTNPAGLYGPQNGLRAINVMTEKDTLESLRMPANARALVYEEAKKIPIAPWLFLAAFGLFIADQLVSSLFLAGKGRLRKSPAVAAVVGLVIGVLLASGNKAAAEAPAKDATAFALQASLETRLAYVLTGDSEADRISQAGLSGLSKILTSRTAVEPGEPMGIDPSRDELVFFPLIYWPVLPNAQPLSDRVLAKIDAYMKQGGLIIFDTKNDETFTGNFGAANGMTPLSQLLGKLDLPPLQRIPEDHVLTKAFYLLQSFPGRWDNGDPWVEARAEGANGAKRAVKSDGVSSIIITSNDLAAAWALDDSDRPMFAVVPGGDEQREMSYRVGINIVMYALTGNYKADQVHVPAILERLGH